MAKEQIYKDLDLTFDINPLTGDVSKKVGVDAIRQSLKNLVLYNIFEKPYSTQFDIGLRNLLFENKGKSFENYLKNRVKIIIQTYEPRVVLNDVVVKGGDDSNSVEISVYYTPIETQTKDTLELFLGKYNGRNY
jgi:phage baseplate assembly protein W